MGPKIAFRRRLGTNTTCSPIWNGLGSDKRLTLHPLLVGFHQATWRGFYTRKDSRNGQTFSSLTGRTSGLPVSVKKRDIANLTHCDPAEIAAIELALKHKGDLSALASLDGVQLQEGASIGAVWVAAEVARRLGLPQALGTDFAGQLALWTSHRAPLGSRLPSLRRPLG